MIRVAGLAEQGLNCSQILIQLGLDEQGRDNPDLVRAIYALAHGAGFYGGTCGALTGAACFLALLAGDGSQGPDDPERLNLMLSELGDWFDRTYGTKYGGLSCQAIAGDEVGTPEIKQRCGMIVIKTYDRTMEILAENS